MPELPEVETTVRALREKVQNRTFLDVWTDSPKIIKSPKNLADFRKEARNKKIERIWRRGKNIIFDLSGNKILLVHQKLTGHLLVGKWKMENGSWRSLIKGPLEDSTNKFLHLIFFLDNGKMLGLSDLRKFAKVVLADKKDFDDSDDIKKLGPEPLEKSFTFEKFEETLRRARGKIKQVLMNQEIIAGIGNIYSDEILWKARINPFRGVGSLGEQEIKKIYAAMKKILNKAVELQGESFSDYRTPTGEKGNFDKLRKVYRREGEECKRCGSVIMRKKIGGRSAHFCPKCQK